MEPGAAVGTPTRTGGVPLWNTCAAEERDPTTYKHKLGCLHHPNRVDAEQIADESADKRDVAGQ